MLPEAWKDAGDDIPVDAGELTHGRMMGYRIGICDRTNSSLRAQAASDSRGLAVDSRGLADPLNEDSIQLNHHGVFRNLMLWRYHFQGGRVASPHPEPLRDTSWFLPNRFEPT